MKRIAIITLCLTSLINAMDYQERVLQINGRSYIGHYLHESESLTFTCVGKRQDISFNFLTQSQDIYTEIAAQGRICPEYYALCRIPSHSNVALFEDSLMLRCFFLNSPSDSATKALALLHLYTATHIKRTCSLENRWIPEK
jgi:hypothetical protein